MEDRTQQMGNPMGGTPFAGPYGERTVVPGGTGDRTAVGVPMRALELDAAPGSRYGYAGGGREHLLVMAKSAAQAIGRRMPLNLALVIDRSGSMEGEPLDYVKRACGYVVDLLEPTDVLSIITFAEQVDVVMPARRVMNKALIKEHINRIQVGNTTNLYDGLVMAAAQVGSVPAGGYLNRILLLTDGEPTAGIKDFTSIVNQVAEMKQRGISVTALGFGSEYNEELMAGIARRSGGNYYYIAQPALIPEVFRRELETLMTVVARNLRVRLRFPRGVQCRYVYGVSQPHITARAAEYTLADVERGSTVVNLSELEFDRHIPGTYRIVRVELTYDDVVTGRTETLFADVVVEFVTDRDRVEQGRNPVVQRELEVHLASRNLEKTMMGMRTQQLTAMGALQELQRTRTILMQSGRADEAQEVTQAIDALQRGGEVEKTLIGTIYNLDQGKKRE
ncbi:MAG: vWA domain-containing protein [Chthonomonadales bacterium]